DETNLAGVSVEKMNPRMAHRLGIDQDIHGLVVTSVKPGTHADQAGLVRGDVISEINRQAVHSVEAYEDAISKLQEDQPALLFIHRRGTPLFLTVKA
ncbi:MAG: PDZ domain-containing protein, partial [Candidatus Binatia bacterium]